MTKIDGTYDAAGTLMMRLRIQRRNQMGVKKSHNLRRSTSAKFDCEKRNKTETQTKNAPTTERNSRGKLRLHST